jgi:hypothetical protein
MYVTTPIQPGQNVPQHHHAETTSVVWTVKHSSAAKRIVPHHRGAKTTSVMCATKHYPATKGNVYREIPVYIFVENVICVQFMSYVIVLCMCYATWKFVMPFLAMLHSSVTSKSFLGMLL